MTRLVSNFLSLIIFGLSVSFWHLRLLVVRCIIAFVARSAATTLLLVVCLLVFLLLRGAYGTDEAGRVLWHL